MLLTTDIKFAKASQRTKSKIAIKNPVEFVIEVSGNNESNNESSYTRERNHLPEDCS